MGTGARGYPCPMSDLSLSRLLDRARYEAADGVAWLAGRTAGFLDETADTLSELSEVAALTTARVSGHLGEAAGRIAAHACGWLADQVSDLGERVSGRMVAADDAFPSARADDERHPERDHRGGHQSVQHTP